MYSMVIVIVIVIAITIERAQLRLDRASAIKVLLGINAPQGRNIEKTCRAAWHNITR